MTGKHTHPRRKITTTAEHFARWDDAARRVGLDWSKWAMWQLDHAAAGGQVVRVETRGVLAAVYRGNRQRLEVVRTHSVFVVGYQDVATLCKRQRVEHLADSCSGGPEDLRKRPTCGICSRVWDRMFGHLLVAPTVLALLLLLGCGGESERSDVEPPHGRVCEVPYNEIVCVFECADCTDAVEGFGSCANALPTALDICSFQEHNPDASP